MNSLNLYLPELRNACSGRMFLDKTDLRNFYQKYSPTLSETAFRRILYALKRQDVIISVDSGVYRLSNGGNSSQGSIKFVPNLSPELCKLYNTIKTAFPYADCLVWETRVLHEFMLHQPGQNQIFLESEKDVVESMFNFLNDRFFGRVFLRPDRLTFERYILPQTDSIIITTLFSQSPHQKVENIPTPKLEKILVDVFANEELFYIFHGEELVHIFEAAFERYKISQKTIFRYAERRKIDQKIRDFIREKTSIILIQSEKVNK
jgi:hypothetical protein